MNPMTPEEVLETVKSTLELLGWEIIAKGVILAQLPVKSIGHQHAFFYFRGRHDGYNYVYSASFESEGRNQLSVVMNRMLEVGFTKEQVVDFIIEFDQRARAKIDDSFAVRMYKE